MDSKFEAAGNREALGERAAFKALLANSGFRNLWYAGLSSSLGDWVGFFAIVALTESILGQTRAAAFAVGGVMVARVVPTLLLGPVAGVFADRWDRRSLMIVTDLVRAGVMILLPFSEDVLALFLATLAVETMTTLFIPAKDAVIPQLVPNRMLVQANQLNLAAGYGTLPISAALFAGLAGIAGLIDVPFFQDKPAAIAIWFNAATFIASAVFVARLPDLTPLRRDRVQDVDAPGAWQELKDGIAFIMAHDLVRSLVVGVMFAAAAAGVVVVIGNQFATLLGAGETGYGILGTLVGVGIFLGVAVSGPLTRRVGKPAVFGPSVGAAGVGLLAAALSPSLMVAALPALVMGMGAGQAFLVGYTLIQERTSDDLRGRTFAAFNTGVRAALFAALVGGPVLLGALGTEPSGVGYRIGGIRITMVLAGLMAVAGGVFATWAIRRTDTAADVLALAGASSRASTITPGLFVSFEGGEGAGKSTQIRLLRAAIERAGHDAVVTREPGGTTIGERVRQILLDPAADAMSDRTEALLYAASRAQHVDEVIRPALEKGAVVLCDRFVDSSVVYQGVARGLGDEQIAELNRWGTGEVAPDLVVVLDIDANEGLRRAGSTPDRLESEGVDFHRRVNRAFVQRARLEPDRYVVVDAAGAVEDIHGRIRDLVLGRLHHG